MVKRHAFFFLLHIFFVVIFVPLSTQGAAKHVREVWSFENEQGADLFSALPERFLVKQLTYGVDALLPRHELVKVLGFDDGSWITPRQLQRGLELLGHQERFQQVVIDGVEHLDGWVFHLTISSWWLLSKVRCRGSLLGKERYRHQYRSEVGQRFDPIKHHDSLVALENSLCDEGYLAPEVVDILSYDDEHKTVAVTLALDPGPQYIIRTLDVEVLDSSPACRSLATKMKQVAVHELYGHAYDKAAVEQAVHELEQLAVHEGFLHSSISYEPICVHENEEVKLVFKVVLGERRQFSFFGNHFFSDRELLDRLMLFGKSVLLVPPSILADELIDFYKNRGFWSVNITWQEEGNKDEGRCLFCISQGQRVRITACSCIGATYFSQKAMADFCSDMIRAPFFDKQKQRLCREQIIRAYLRAGFWDCVIEKEEFIPLTIDSFEYRVTIHEGQQRFLCSVAVPGFEEALRDVSPFIHVSGNPIPFDMYLVQEQRQVLLSYLQAQGYLLADPKPILNQRDGSGIDLIWEINGSDQVRFGTTVVAGATRLPPQLIRRELLYEEGKVWDQKKVDASAARLRALGIFESVTVQPIEYPDFPRKQHDVENGSGGILKKDLVVSCIDDDPFEIRARAGMQCIGQNFQFRNLGARLGGAFVWKNPTNNADHLQVNLDVSPYMQYGELSYALPWLYDWPVLTTTSLYTSRYDQPLVTCGRERLYRLAQDGCSISFEHDTDGMKFGCTFGFESMRVSQISARLARLIDFSPRLIDKRVPYLYAEPLAIINRLDDLYNPTYGTSTTATAKIMVPFKDIESGFLKLLIEQSFFVPLWQQAVGALHLRAGHIFNLDFDNIMPSERFYLGGAYSLRGYDTDTAPPVSCCSNHLDDPCLLPIGGKSVLGLMAEVRFPLYKALGGVIFTDCGVLVRKHFRDDNLVGATGFGLRYATPVGPVRFDIAWKWQRQRGEDHRFAWFLTFGQAF